MSKATGETEHLKGMLVGNVLAVSMHDVAKTAVLYGVIGIFHYIFRKQFLLISTDPEKAVASGVKIRFWDFLFYASFGFVVSSSVSIAGVLLVFCYLVVPSVGAMAVCRQDRPQACRRMDDGHAGVRTRCLFLCLLRQVDGRDDCLYLRRSADPDVCRAHAVFPWKEGA